MHIGKMNVSLRNNTLGNNSHETLEHHSNDFKYFTLFTQAVCMLILVAGLLGNILVLIVFGRRWTALKSFEKLLTSLAVADLIATVVVPSNMLHEISAGNFHFIGDAGCKIVSFLSTSSVTVSSITLIFISIDRYIIVKWPMRMRPTRSKVTIIIVVKWLLGCSLGIIYLIGDRLQLYQEGSLMKCRLNSTEQEVTLLAILNFIIQTIMPLLMMIILYALIIRELRQTANVHFFQSTERERRARYSQNRRTMLLLITIVAVFFVCVSPQNLFYLLYHFDSHGLSGYQVYTVHVFLSMLQMSNSCMNPIIYSKLHTTFRRQLLSILHSCYSKKFTIKESIPQSVQSALTSSLRILNRRLSSRSLSITTNKDCNQASGSNLLQDHCNEKNADAREFAIVNDKSKRNSDRRRSVFDQQNNHLKEINKKASDVSREEQLIISFNKGHLVGYGSKINEERSEETFLFEETLI